MDHDPETANIRDWVCNTCNTNLGKWRTLMQIAKALAYVALHTKAPMPWLIGRSHVENVNLLALKIVNFVDTLLKPATTQNEVK